MGSDPLFIYKALGLFLVFAINAGAELRKFKLAKNGKTSSPEEELIFGLIKLGALLYVAILVLVS